MNEFRLDLYLEQIEIAAHRTMEFVGHQTRDEFLADVKTQHAVAMSIAVMGEAATKIFNLYSDFIANSPDIKLAGNTWYAAPHCPRVFQYRSRRRVADRTERSSRSGAEDRKIANRSLGRSALTD